MRAGWNLVRQDLIRLDARWAEKLIVKKVLLDLGPVPAFSLNFLRPELAVSIASLARQ